MKFALVFSEPRNNLLRDFYPLFFRVFIFFALVAVILTGRSAAVSALLAAPPHKMTANPDGVADFFEFFLVNPGEISRTKTFRYASKLLDNRLIEVFSVFLMFSVAEGNAEFVHVIGDR